MTRPVIRALAALVLPLTLTACATLETEPDLRIALRPLDSDAIGVEVRFRGDADGVTRLAVLPTWGGTEAEAGWFDAFRAHGDGGVKIPVERVGPHAVELAQTPGAPVTLSYRLTGLPSGYGDVDDYRPIRSADYAAVFTPLAVFLPEHLTAEPDGPGGGAPRELDLVFRWVWDGDTAPGASGWEAFGSFGRGPGPHRGRYAPGRVIESFVAAGRLDSETRRTRGGSFATVRIGAAGAFTPAELADLVEPIVRETRAFFAEAEGGRADPWYMVSFAPAGEPIENGFALGGTAVTNAFSFYFDPGLDLAAHPDLFEVVAHILCHEYFHNWNGVLFFIAEPAYEHESRWIVEGFTDFFARRLLLRAGVYGVEAHAAAINTRVAEYAENPLRGVGNRQAANAWDTDPALSDMIYQRGELLAMLIDEEVRAGTGGEESLDDLMLELTRRARAGEREADPEWVLGWVAARTGEAFADRVRRLVEHGGDVPLPDQLTEPGLVLERVPDSPPRYALPG